MSNKKSYIVGGIVSFLILIGIAVVFFGNITKPKKLLDVPETATVAKITKDDKVQEVTGNQLNELREALVNLEVREYGQESTGKYEGILVRFYENDTECAWFRIVDEKTIWDFSKALEKGVVIVYKTEVDLLEMISKY